MKIYKPATFLVVFFGFFAWVFYKLQWQPIAHIIEICASPLSALSIYAVFHPIINDLIPTEMQDHPNLQLFFSGLEKILTKPIPCPSWLFISVLIITISSFSSILDLIKPHLNYRNPQVIIYTKNWKDDQEAFVETINHNSFLQFIEPIKSEIHDNEVLKISPPQEFNAIFCTPFSEIAAKNLAIDLGKKGVTFQYIGAITNPEHRNKAQIQIGRSYLPLLKKYQRALTPDEIKQANCSS